MQLSFYIERVPGIWNALRAPRADFQTFFGRRLRPRAQLRVELGNVCSR